MLFILLTRVLVLIVHSSSVHFLKIKMVVLVTFHKITCTTSEITLFVLQLYSNAE